MTVEFTALETTSDRDIFVPAFGNSDVGQAEIIENFCKFHGSLYLLDFKKWQSFT